MRWIITKDTGNAFEHDGQDDQDYFFAPCMPVYDVELEFPFSLSPEDMANLTPRSKVLGSNEPMDDSLIRKFAEIRNQDEEFDESSVFDDDEQEQCK